MNNRTHFLYGMLVLLFVALLSCNDPKIVFPDAQTIPLRFTGFVAPAGETGMAYLYDETAIDSASINPSTGYYAFNSVAWGTYQLRIIVPGYGVHKEIVYVDRTHTSASTVTLLPYPSQIAAVSPADSSQICFSSCAESGSQPTLATTDTTAEFRIEFQKQMDTASLFSSLSIKPQLPYNKSFRKNGTGSTLVITIPVVPLFGTPSFTIAIDKKVQTIYGEPLDFDYVLHYFINQSCLNQAVFAEYIRQTTPANELLFVAPGNDVYIVFRHPMNELSVEKALSIAPAEPMNFFWTSTKDGMHLLRIQFASPLATSTRYVVSIDSTATTSTLIHLPAPLQFSFTTAAFRVENCAPLHGATNVPVDSSFIYQFITAVDSVSFTKAFSITPQVDSFWIVVSDKGKTVSVHHPWLLSNHTYTIVIDTVLANQKGTRLSSSFSHTFTTSSYPSIIREIMPPDTLVPVPVTDTLSVLFAGAMHPGSFAGKLHIEPECPLVTLWQTTEARLDIIPIQPLRSNSTYSFSIDSGYVTAYGTAGAAYRSEFKTVPLVITTLAPFHGRINVPTTAPIELTFNMPIDSASFLNAFTSLPPLDSMQARFMHGTTSTTCTVVHAPFTPGTLYTITMSTLLTDIYGIPMPRPYTFTFTTE